MASGFESQFLSFSWGNSSVGRAIEKKSFVDILLRIASAKVTSNGKSYESLVRFQVSPLRRL